MRPAEQQIGDFDQIGSIHRGFRWGQTGAPRARAEAARGLYNINPALQTRRRSAPLPDRRAFLSVSFQRFVVIAGFAHHPLSTFGDPHAVLERPP